MDGRRVEAPAVTLFGIPVHAVTAEQALDIVDDAIARRAPLHIGVVNAAKVVNMQRDPSLRDDVMSSDLILADGIAVVWASRLLRRPLPERVTGIDLMMGMLRHGQARRYRIYCLGATEEVSHAVADRIAADFPNVVVAGRHHGYFSESEEAEIAQQVATARPDILFVAITSPKKERFLAHWSATMDVPVCHGVGGSFDVLAGKVERAPERWQRLGLEWLYRVKQEPGRLWRRYLVTNTLFCVMLARELWRQVFATARKQSSRS
jgi:N-acetylglucosaminyldiphosphoundecaprenol N-acetyl-beta-D-mannosaminyltransferase